MSRAIVGDMVLMDVVRGIEFGLDTEMSTGVIVQFGQLIVGIIQVRLLIMGIVQVAKELVEYQIGLAPYITFTYQFLDQCIVLADIKLKLEHLGLEKLQVEVVSDMDPEKLQVKLISDIDLELVDHLVKHLSYIEFMVEYLDLMEPRAEWLPIGTMLKS